MNPKTSDGSMFQKLLTLTMLIYVAPMHSMHKQDSLEQLRWKSALIATQRGTLNIFNEHLPYLHISLLQILLEEAASVRHNDVSAMIEALCQRGADPTKTTVLEDGKIIKVWRDGAESEVIAQKLSPLQIAQQAENITALEALKKHIP